MSIEQELICLRLEILILRGERLRVWLAGLVMRWRLTALCGPRPAPAAECVRRRGSITARYTGSELREIAENLTASGFRFLRETRGMPGAYEIRRRVARECRLLRDVNAAFSVGGHS